MTIELIISIGWGMVLFLWTRMKLNELEKELNIHREHHVSYADTQSLWNEVDAINKSFTDFKLHEEGKEQAQLLIDEWYK